MVPMPKIAWSAAASFWRMANISSWRRIMRRAFDALLLGEREQFGRFLLLEVLEIHVSFQSGVGMTHAPRPTGSGRL